MSIRAAMANFWADKNATEVAKSSCATAFYSAKPRQDHDPSRGQILAWRPCLWEKENK